MLGDKTSKSSRYPISDLIAMSIIILLAHIALGTQIQVFEGKLGDTDVYMWLNRVLQLHQTGEWFNHLNPDINPPNGHVQHWTRPFDSLLYIGAYFGSSIFGFDKALEYWSLLLGPLFHILTLAALFWAVIPLATEKSQSFFSILGLLYLGQAFIMGNFYIGRADHQILLMFLFAMSIGFMVRLLTQHYQRRWTIWFGAAAALSLWVGMESLLMVVLVQITLGLRWLFGNQTSAIQLRDYFASLSLFSAIALLADRGVVNYFSHYADKISFSYVFSFCLVALFWMLIVAYVNNKKENQHGLIRRLSYSLIGLVIVFALLSTLFPGFFSSPLSEVDELYRTIRLINISELRPLFSWVLFQSDEGVTHVARLIAAFGLLIPAAFIFIPKACEANSKNVWFWRFICLGVLLFVFLGLRQNRWAVYGVMLLLPAYAIWTERTVDYLTAKFYGVGQIVIKLSFIILCSVGFSMFWLTIKFQDVFNSVNARTKTQSEICDLRYVVDELNDFQNLGKNSKHVMTLTDLGPELMYRTNHKVYSIPNHRYQPGFTDSYTFFNTSDESTAYLIAKQRNIDLVLVCTLEVANEFYDDSTDEVTFYRRLTGNYTPDWLEEVLLSPQDNRVFRLFVVNSDL